MNSWETRPPRIKADETQHDLRRSIDECVFPYIPKARQQRTGLLIDFLNMKGTSSDTDIIDLLMFGENKFGVLLANLPGTVSASLEDLSMVKAALRDQKSSNSSAAALRALDYFFSENFQSEKGVTAFYTFFDQHARQINFASAGHLAMLLYRPSENKIYRLNTAGVPIGRAVITSQGSTGHFNSSLPQIKSENAEFVQNDLLVLYSEGVLKARNTWGESFGMQRLLQLIRKNGHLQPTPFLVEFQNTLESFTLGEIQEFDSTAIAIKNMLPIVDKTESDAVASFRKKFLSIEDEEHLFQIADKYPEARISELMDLLGDRYIDLGHEVIRSYLNSARNRPSVHPKNGTARPFKKVTGEKNLQQRLLQSFPARQLIFKKYEFRGNTGVIGKALEYYQDGKYQDSLIEFMKVRKAIAESESVFCFFGNLYLLLNMPIKAKQEFLKALKLNPKSTHAICALAYVALVHEDYEGVISNLSTAIRLDDNLAEYYTFLQTLVKSINSTSDWIT